MGIFFSDRVSKDLKRIVLCGSRLSGKTSIIYRWKLGDFIETVATSGILHESFTYEARGENIDNHKESTCMLHCMKRIKVDVHEIGNIVTSTDSLIAFMDRLMSCVISVKPIRRSISDILKSADAIVYVVDSTDQNSISTLVADIRYITNVSDFDKAQCRLIILFNKQDFRDAAKPIDSHEIYDFRPHALRRVFVLGCSAISGQGVEEALRCALGIC